MPVSNRRGPAGRAVISSSLERTRRRPPDLQAFADPAGPEVQPLPPGARRLRAARPQNYCVTEEPCAAAGLSLSQARDWYVLALSCPWFPRVCRFTCDYTQWACEQAMKGCTARRPEDRPRKPFLRIVYPHP